VTEGGKEGDGERERERGREGERERGREAGRERGREGESEGGREGGRVRGRAGGRETTTRAQDISERADKDLKTNAKISTIYRTPKLNEHGAIMTHLGAVHIGAHKTRRFAHHTGG